MRSGAAIAAQRILIPAGVAKRLSRGLYLGMDSQVRAAFRHANAQGGPGLE